MIVGVPYLPSFFFLAEKTRATKHPLRVTLYIDSLKCRYTKSFVLPLWKQSKDRTCLLLQKVRIYYYSLLLWMLTNLMNRSVFFSCVFVEISWADRVKFHELKKKKKWSTKYKSRPNTMHRFRPIVFNFVSILTFKKKKSKQNDVKGKHMSKCWCEMINIYRCADSFCCHRSYWHQKAFIDIKIKSISIESTLQKTAHLVSQNNGIHWMFKTFFSPFEFSQMTQLTMCYIVRIRGILSHHELVKQGLVAKSALYACPWENVYTYT